MRSDTEATWGSASATWGEHDVASWGDEPLGVTLTLRGRVVWLDIATDATGSTVTARIEPG